MNKVIDIEKGKIVIATDIHGNWKDYTRIKEKFKELNGDFLVFSGDLIHGYEGYEDKSVEILDDLIDKADPKVIALAGNHELMNIYHWDVTKNGVDFTREFEEKIKGNRKRYIKYMKKMPFAVRTKGGVFVNHAGANPLMNEQNAAESFAFMNGCNHEYLLEEILQAAKKQGITGLNVHEFNPEIATAMYLTNIGTCMEHLFFNKNEYEYGTEKYHKMQEDFLKAMSNGTPQKFMISGHITEEDGFKIVGDKQLRICSSKGADKAHKTIAVIDAEKEYKSMGELVSGLVRVYD